MLVLKQRKNNASPLCHTISGLQTDVMAVTCFSYEVRGNIGEAMDMFGCIHDDVF